MKKTIIITGISMSLFGCSLSSGNQEEIPKQVVEDSKVEVSTEKNVSAQEKNSPDKNAAAETSVVTEQNQTHTEHTEAEHTDNEVAESSADEITENSNKKVTENSEEIKVNETEKVKTSGIFYGLADSNSVEVEYEGEINNLSFEESLYNKMNELPYEAKVEFTYIKNSDGKNIITEINVME